jgi:hypothetical protein
VVVTLPTEFTSRQPLPVAKKRLVVEAVVVKRLVVVAFVPVAFTNVKFWRVEEALSKRLAPVIELAVIVPMLPEVLNKLVEDAVVLKKFVEVAEVEVELPIAKREMLPLVLKSPVLEAVVLKKFVVVAAVPVARTKVKFWRVEEPLARKLVEVRVPRVAFEE